MDNAGLIVSSLRCARKTNYNVHFKDGFPTLLYFYGPLAAIITVNVVLFIKTALKIKEMERDTQMLRMDETSKQAHERDKQRFESTYKNDD